MSQTIESKREVSRRESTLLAIAVRLSFILFALMVALAISSMSPGQSPSLSSMVYEGFTEPRHDIMVAATEIGRLEAVTVEVGDEVREGQVIGNLEDALQASSVKIAKLQTEMIGERQAARAEVELHLSRTTLLRQLAAEDMARPDELARAETDLQIASARLLQAEEQLKLRGLELERYQLQLERRKIRVPMDGVISKLFRKPGEYITPGDPAVVRLLVMDKMYGVFNVPVEDTTLIRIGAPAMVYLRSTATTIRANISSIAPDIDGESGTVQVRVELDNAERKLLAGDRCTLRLTPGAGPEPAIPTSARLPAVTPKRGRAR